LPSCELYRAHYSKRRQVSTVAIHALTVMLLLRALISSAGSLQLVLVHDGDESVLDDDLKELAYFGFCSGCTLQITRA